MQYSIISLVEHGYDVTSVNTYSVIRSPTVLIVYCIILIYLFNRKRDSLLSTSCGSFAYACPEILKGILYDGRSADVWSSGIILYALLCGCLPFDGNSAKNLVKQIRVELKLPTNLSLQATELLRGILKEDSRQRLKLKEIRNHSFIC